MQVQTNCVCRTFCDLQDRKSDVKAELDQAELPQVFADLWPQQVVPPIAHSKGDVDWDLLLRPRPGRAHGDVQQLEKTEITATETQQVSEDWSKLVIICEDLYIVTFQLFHHQPKVFSVFCAGQKTSNSDLVQAYLHGDFRQ